MAENSEIYWERWEKLLEAAANIQGLLPGSVMIGGSAAAIHLQHRYSFDADHILSNLKDNYAEVLDFLEGRDDWKTARINPPKLILGSFQGVETGIRQLRRNRPLETETIDMGGKSITMPTILEMLRTKGWMIISRNATRDYIDFAALAKHISMEGTIDALKDFNAYYSDLIRVSRRHLLFNLFGSLQSLNRGISMGLTSLNTKELNLLLDSWVNITRICLSL